MDNRFVLMTEYFRARNLKRRKEILKSIKLNCEVSQIKRVIVFVDPEVGFPISLRDFLSNENYNKIEIRHTPLGHRSTYSDFFSYANKNLVGENCIISNNDIAFDESLDEINKAEEFKLGGHFICLTRWELMPDNSLKFKEPAWVRKNSQDAWIFKSPAPKKMIKKGEFYLGRPGCDGMIAYLATISGLKVFNPSKLIKIKHLHLSNHRTYSRKHRLGGPDIYMCTFPTDKLAYDPSSVMYTFNHPKQGSLRGAAAVDRAKSREIINEDHWAWALQKCKKY
tara:strand:- start:55 stop:897 length:843 start_codon:yes stop_codon:yes gene_type:complete